MFLLFFLLAYPYCSYRVFFLRVNLFLFVVGFLLKGFRLKWAIRGGFVLICRVFSVLKFSSVGGGCSYFSLNYKSLVLICGFLFAVSSLVVVVVVVTRCPYARSAYIVAGSFKTYKIPAPSTHPTVTQFSSYCPILARLFPPNSHPISLHFHSASTPLPVRFHFQSTSSPRLKVEFVEPEC